MFGAVSFVTADRTMLMLRKGLAVGMVALAIAGAVPSWGHDPIRDLERALRHAQAGDRSLARSHLDPVLISPRIDRATRARVYYTRGILHYLDGHWVSASQDYRRALEFERELAIAQSALAWLHLHGLGVRRDAQRALELYERAAHNGHAEAQFNLGLLLTQGKVAEPDPERALHWLEAAAGQDHVEAMAQAGQLLLRSRPGGPAEAARMRARTLLGAAAERGHLRAQLELGILLSSGPSATQDTASAHRWLEAAAARGSASAQGRLGYLYLHGIGVEADPVEARVRFAEAARQGEASAQAHLGWLHERGLGGAVDHERAFTWYRRAANRGHATAQLNLALLYQAGRGVRADDREARHWFEQAADAGNASARSALAWLLATASDPGVRDPDRAIALARKAVAEAPSASWFDTLAAALATSGRFEDAVNAQQQALEVLEEEAANGRNTEARRSEFLGRLARYEAGRPWYGED